MVAVCLCVEQSLLERRQFHPPPLWCQHIATTTTTTTTLVEVTSMPIFKKRLSLANTSESGEEMKKKKGAVPVSVSTPIGSVQSYDDIHRGLETSSSAGDHIITESRKTKLRDEGSAHDGSESSKSKKKGKKKEKEKLKEKEEETDGDSFSKLLQLHGSGLWAILEFGKDRNQDELAYHLYQMAEAMELTEDFVLGMIDHVTIPSFLVS
jgi:hypothetical protein